MSVAFRREDDDEHKEPRFEIPIPVGPNLVTARGLAQIEGKVAGLEAMVPDAADETAVAEHKRDLRYWRTRLATAQLMPVPTVDVVAFGSSVEYRLKGKVGRIDIVGDDEAEPGAGRIAFSAPLARALIGGFVGEKIDFAGQPEAIEILAVGSIAAG